ncbi:ATP-dependent zinc protease family protein [Coralloluteibacterium stylophorae]|uniref:ATP-dependent zinc protease n=1 Tax=Coralloluteibacterium stylophorae TaxID=1776034 RepID=A0A8J8AXA0_9GAMM|nr:RimK/LysX family protein [Coralloluteibacterium stylophorae]MBS7458281.1 RimK/LysX family protein [Coralloluteibacterium stylophorae]
MAERRVVGWREWAALPGFGIAAIRAKIDTGARSSALHVETLETFPVDGVERVRFVVDAGSGGRATEVETDVLTRRIVTDSGGHRTERIFVRGLLQLAGLRLDIEINLCSRHNMRFPMLIGRSALGGRFAVDPALSWTAGTLPATDLPA